MLKLIKKYRSILLVFAIFLGVGFYFCLPKTLFDDPYALVLNDQEGELLSARIANDGQWRFPEVNSLPEKYKIALLTFEDKNFYSHMGVDFLALGNAIKQNVKAGTIIRGGSTISMQLIRLHRKGKGRSIKEKLIEMVLAFRLELRYSKDEILNLYASHAPFGSNNVGISAASWRYFERPIDELSWAEAALLAILPNQPSLLYPGRSNEYLKNKRDRLLAKLYHLGQLDEISYELALSEPLPSGPKPLPQLANHYLDFASKKNVGRWLIESSLQEDLQEKVNQTMQAHYSLLKNDGIHNAAILVLDVKQNQVLAYGGNVPHLDMDHAGFVDMIQANRSTGSLLKPFLYASLLDEGQILPRTLIKDVPTFYAGFAPKNYDRTYDGVVHADLAISRSLNVPAVNMLKMYGYPKFHQKLQDLGISSLKNEPGHYGLSMILGGAEGSLWEMSNAYASMARGLQNFNLRPAQSRYHSSDWYFAGDDEDYPRRLENPPIRAAATWFTFEAMTKVYRPNEEANWQMYESSRKIAWKTGTSFGYRDGWAIGVTPEYVVGVWVGNADGEGRPGLTGIKAAAPIMLDVFDLLPETSWFIPPRQELTVAAIDRQSGYLASPYSIDVDTLFIPKVGLRTVASPYHKRVHLSQSGEHQVNRDCYPSEEIRSQNWFELPPAEAFYFRKKNPTYRELPIYMPGCQVEQLELMAMLYPDNNARVHIPIEQDGNRGEMILEATHQRSDAKLHWHLDGQFLGATVNEHQMAISPRDGVHQLSLVDELGNTLVRQFSTSGSRAED